jgi:hypothetical protein
MGVSESGGFNSGLIIWSCPPRSFVSSSLWSLSHCSLSLRGRCLNNFSRGILSLSLVDGLVLHGHFQQAIFQTSRIYNHYSNKPSTFTSVKMKFSATAIILSLIAVSSAIPQPQNVKGKIVIYSCSKQGLIENRNCPPSSPSRRSLYVSRRCRRSVHRRWTQGQATGCPTTGPR